MRGVGAREPVGGHTVVQAEGVQTNLEGTQVQIAVWACVVVGGCRLGEQTCGAVASSLGQHCLSQLKHEVS